MDIGKVVADGADQERAKSTAGLIGFLEQPPSEEHIADKRLSQVHRLIAATTTGADVRIDRRPRALHDRIKTHLRSRRSARSIANDFPISLGHRIARRTRHRFSAAWRSPTHDSRTLHANPRSTEANLLRNGWDPFRDPSHSRKSQPFARQLGSLQGPQPQSQNKSWSRGDSHPRADTSCPPRQRAFPFFQSRLGHPRTAGAKPKPA